VIKSVLWNWCQNRDLGVTTAATAVAGLVPIKSTIPNEIQKPATFQTQENSAVYSA